MQKFKLAIALCALCVFGFLLYAFVLYPVLWRSSTKHKSISLLKAAQNTADLTNAVGTLGVVIQLTNNSWIAIRYRDSHSGNIRSFAVARDSGGGWYESERHFCGSLSFWPRLKSLVADEEEQRKLNPEWFTNRVSRADSDNGSFPTYKEMMAIESAPDLESARAALKKIGFTEFHP